MTETDVPDTKKRKRHLDKKGQHLDKKGQHLDKKGQHLDNKGQDEVVSLCTTEDIGVDRENNQVCHNFGT